MMASKSAGFFLRTFSKLHPLAILRNSQMKSSKLFIIQSSSSFHTFPANCKENSISITLKMANGTEHILRAKEGETILDCIKNNQLEIEGYGQCDGGASCSTCHVVFKPQDFEKLDQGDDVEADILDLTHNSRETSRLGCQVILKEEMDKMEIFVPSIREDIREPKSDYSSV